MHRTSEADLDQRHATQDERAQDALAELGLGDEQRPQRLGRNDDRLHVTDRSGVDHAQVRPSGELTDLGHDLARDHLRHFLERGPDQLRERGHWHGLAQPIARHDRDPAGQDHVHPGDGLSRLEQELSGREPPDLAETSDAVDLGRGEDRKHLVEPRRQGGVGCGLTVAHCASVLILLCRSKLGPNLRFPPVDSRAIFRGCPVPPTLPRFLRWPASSRRRRC